MTPERWQQIKAVLDRALELAPGERSAFLDRACARDPSLRNEVEELLASGKEMRSSFMNTSPFAHQPLAEGTRLGDYEVQTLLGAGGMGEVYRARDLRLRRDVAVKVLPSFVSSDPERLRRFEQEATAAAALNHPNILAVYQMGTHQRTPYLVSELLEGETLREQIRRGRLAVRKAIDYAVQIARGLAAAHEKGIVHRDLKPENLFVTKDGRLKILDFGLAKLLQAQPSAEQSAPTLGSETEPGVVMGTVGYMAPEQVRGQPADHRADIFAFGTIFYEMLSGKRAFQKPTSPETMTAILNDDPPGISQLVPDLPPALQRVVHRCLEKNPEQRFQSASDLAFALEALSDTGVSRSGTEVPQRRSNSRWIVAVVLTAAVVLLGVGLLKYRLLNPVGPSPEWVQLTNFVDSATAPALSPDGRMLAFIRGPDPFVTKGEIYLKLLPEGNPVQLTHDDTMKMSPVFSPDGSQIAYTVAGHWDAWSVPTLGGEPRLMMPNASGLTWIDAQHLLFSEIKQGRHMAIVTSMENRNAERDVWLPPGEASMAHRSSVSPDGKWVLVVWMGRDGGWRPCELAPFEGGSAAKSVGPADAECTAAAWSPDGRWMYFSSAAGGRFHLWRQRFPDGVPQQITSGAAEEEGIAIAPDGRSLVTSVGTAETSVWVHDRGGDHQVTSQGAAYFLSPDDTSSRAVFSPDGQRVYYLGERSRGKSLDLWTTELGSGRSDVLVNGLSASGFDLSPDGRSVAYSVRAKDGTESIWVAFVDHRSPPRQIKPSINEFSPLFTPDGNLVFMSSEGDKSFIYRMNQDGSGRRKITPDPVVLLQTVSPDGQWAVAQVGFPGEDPPRGTVAIPVSAGARVRLCHGLCATRWALNGKSLFLSVAGASHTFLGWRTFVIPLPPGKLFPKLPPSGVTSERDAAALSGARMVDNYVMPGVNEGTYAFNRETGHRNLFRIPLP
jgi:eukaryotic-like serine/threonine-protein kinase